MFKQRVFRSILIISIGALLPKIAISLCVKNDYFESFSIIQPIHNELVTNLFYIKEAVSAYDIPLVHTQSGRFSVCVKVGDQEERCGISLFEEFLVELSEVGNHKINVDLLVDNSFRMCSSTVIARCCINNEAEEKVRLQQSIDKSVSNMISWKREIGLNLAGRPTNNNDMIRRKNCPWCCIKPSQSNDMTVVFGIKSAGGNIHYREAIRRSWLSQLPSYSCAYFIIGRSGADLIEENNFIDSYSGISNTEEVPRILIETIRNNYTLVDYLKHQTIIIEKFVYDQCTVFDCSVSHDRFRGISGDILDGHEIVIEDSYANLVYKTALFIKWISMNRNIFMTKTSSTQKSLVRPEYVIMIDDDVYVRPSNLFTYILKYGVDKGIQRKSNFGSQSSSNRLGKCCFGAVEGDFAMVLTYKYCNSSNYSVDNLVDPEIEREYFTGTEIRGSLYGGEVFSQRFHRPMKPLRSSYHKNYLSKQQYPQEVLPAFVVGNFIILSHDAVSFIAHNIDEYFRPVGNLEDVTLAVWLQSLQLYPTHIPGVISLFDAIQLKYLSHPLIVSDSNIDNILLNVQHACCRCTAESEELWRNANMTEKTPDYFPLIAIHGIKNIVDFDLINDIERNSTALATTLIDLLIKYHSDKFLCDIKCLHNAVIDHAIVSGA